MTLFRHVPIGHTALDFVDIRTVVQVLLLLLVVLVVVMAVAVATTGVVVFVWVSVLLFLSLPNVAVDEAVGVVVRAEIAPIVMCGSSVG